jgi:hypothetical protein
MYEAQPIWHHPASSPLDVAVLNYFVFQSVDRGVEPLKSLSQDIHARLGGNRKRRIAVGKIEQLVDATYPLGGDNAEFRKRSALTLIVRCLVSNSRVLCSINIASLLKRANRRFCSRS